MTMNKMIIIGNLGTDPEMRYTPNGQAVTNFSVATNHRYTAADGERRDETEWFRVSAWGKLGELCNQYLVKGKKVYLEGRLKSRSYETRDGETRFSIDIFASEVRFLDAAGARSDDAPSGGDPDRDTGSGLDADNLPF